MTTITAPNTWLIKTRTWVSFDTHGTLIRKPVTTTKGR
jgi:hypothetical protein